MDDDMAIFLITVVALLIFSVGVIFGNQATSKDIKEDLCKQLNTETTSYFACKEKQLDEIIKELK